MEQTTYQVNLDKFSGPLEKLLELIEEKQLEITLVNLAKVTGDFLDYLKNLDDNAKHPSVLADFVVIASKLLLIKSKALLPTLELTEDEEKDIKDLELRLKIYREFAARGLKKLNNDQKITRDNASDLFLNLWNRQQSSYSRELFTNLPPVFYPSKNLTINNLELKILELIKELKSLIPEEQTVKRIIITVEQEVKELLVRFKEQAEHSFKNLSKDKSKIEIIMIFLAILHLVRDRLVKIRQNDQFSDIIVKAHLEEDKAT